MFNIRSARAVMLMLPEKVVPEAEGLEFVGRGGE